MTTSSTTIRVTIAQRERLRILAEQRASSMAETLDAALESLRREQFFSEMALAEASLQANHQDWQPYAAERDRWLNADLG